MKRFLFTVIGILLLGAGLGYLFESKSSYVLLSYEDYAIETSLWFLFIASWLLFFAVVVLFRFLKLLYKPGRRFEVWASDRRVVASKRDFYQALVDFELGVWDKALKRFRASSANLERPLVAYLYAARAAQKLERSDLREELLQDALHLEPQSALTVGLVRAELLQQEGDFLEAEKVLKGLQVASPKNNQVQVMLAEVKENLGTGKDLVEQAG